MATSSTELCRATRGFRHEAVVYRGMDSMVDLVVPFLRKGLDRGEPVLVCVPADRIAALRRGLGAQAARVVFVDMAQIGRNPACIIPVWRQFVQSHPGEPTVRGVGEPVWAGRRPAEIDECRLHEALLNVTFDGGPRWQLLCPYDGDALPPDVIEGVRRTHPVVGPHPSGGAVTYAGHAPAFVEFARPLPDPPPRAQAIPFGPEELLELRGVVRRLCDTGGLTADAGEDLVLAAHELATNSVLHGGGRGVLNFWQDDDALVLDISDAGVITDPLVGRELEAALSENGRGVWMANQLCDLVQVRSSPSGTSIRLYAWT